MSFYRLIVTLSWIGSASLQYISNTGPAGNNIISNFDPEFNHQIPNTNYAQFAPTRNIDRYNNERSMFDALFPNIFLSPPSPRVKRMPKDREMLSNQIPNYVDTENSLFSTNDGEPLHMQPFLVQRYEEYANTMDNNTVDNDETLDGIGKKSFSPWGGKRDIPSIAQNKMWTWKRSISVQEPSMPKRVRFSPWGGKRSSQLIFKPENKASKIIFSGTIPEFARIFYSPKGTGINVAGIQLIPAIDKLHPVKILALSSKINDKAFLEADKLYKPGSTFKDVTLKKDGKRKVKFSSWGGKRSSPIIGPIWKPPSPSIQNEILDTILLIKKAEKLTDESI